MIMASRLLDGKIALVTGVGKNIGRGIALALTDDGTTIGVNGRSDQSTVDETVEVVRGSALSPTSRTQMRWRQ